MGGIKFLCGRPKCEIVDCGGGGGGNLWLFVSRKENNKNCPPPPPRTLTAVFMAGEASSPKKRSREILLFPEMAPPPQPLPFPNIAAPSLFTIIVTIIIIIFSRMSGRKRVRLLCPLAFDCLKPPVKERELTGRRSLFSIFLLCHFPLSSFLATPHLHLSKRQRSFFSPANKTAHFSPFSFSCAHPIFPLAKVERKALEFSQVIGFSSPSP